MYRNIWTKIHSKLKILWDYSCVQTFDILRSVCGNAFWEWYLKRFYENYLRPYTCTLTKGTIKAKLCLTLHAKIDRSDRFNQIY